IRQPRERVGLELWRRHVLRLVMSVSPNTAASMARGKPRGVLDAIRLKQMAVIVSRENLEPGADGEPNTRDERITKPHVVHIEVGRGVNDAANRGVAGDEARED